jgi:plasmid stabilization system protein ParE
MIRVEITEEAQQDIDNIEEFLLQNWNEKVLLNFYDKLENAITILESGKVFFEKYEDTKYRKFLLTKHNTMICDVRADVLYVLRVINNFQNPEDNYESISK